MKQHITVKQVSELGEKEKKTLCDWLDSKGYSLDYKNSKAVSTLLSIGQLIEFLYDKKPEWDLNIDHYFGEPILCDALWEAVKEILEK